MVTKKTAEAVVKELMGVTEDLYRPKKFVYKDLKFIYAYDGDSIDFLIKKSFDFGFGFKVKGEKKIRVRLYGMDTFEIRDKNPKKKKKAYVARDFVRDRLSKADHIELETIKDKTGKYGRYLGVVYYIEGDKKFCLNSQLVSMGLTTGKTFTKKKVRW